MLPAKLTQRQAPPPLPAPIPTSARVPGPLWVVPLLLLLFAVVALRHAWVADDAYITVRTVDNFVRGDGLTWNVGERVQAFTHPLWLLLLIPLHQATLAPYAALLTLSLLCATAAVGLLLFAYRRRPTTVLFMAAALTLSPSFVDYATSGLENPLTHLLLVAFLLRSLAGVRRPRDLFLLSLLAGLGALNRMDTALIFYPVLLAAWLSTYPGRGLPAVIQGQLPFVAWLVFSLVYYGFPLPNTAYAKLPLDPADQAAVWQQGSYYLLNLLERDPLACLVIAAGVVWGLVAGGARRRVIALGVVAYVVYVVAIGGDFMSGRFFTAPLLAAVVLLANFDLRRAPVAAAALAAVIGLGLSTPAPTLLRPLFTGYTVDELDRAIDAHGIADERAFYAGYTGLLRPNRADGIPSRLWWERIGSRLRAPDAPLIIERNIGFLGYAVGPGLWVVDEYGLADPLLARLPPVRAVQWRIGHRTRHLPAGYTDSLLSGENRLQDPQLAVYYDYLRLIVRGDLWDPARWEAIRLMNLGLLDHLIDVYAYRYPQMVYLAWDDLNHDAAENRVPPVTLTDSGLTIYLAERAFPQWLEIGVQPANGYEIAYLLDGDILARHTLLPTYDAAALVTRVLEVPPVVQAQGVTMLRVLPTTANGERTVGHLRMITP